MSVFRSTIRWLANDGFSPSDAHRIIYDPDFGEMKTTQSVACRACGTWFVGNRRGSPRYCSTRCRSRGHREGML